MNSLKGGMRRRSRARPAVRTLAVCVPLLGAVLFAGYIRQLANPRPRGLSEAEAQALSQACRVLRPPLLSPLPYQAAPPSADFAAGSVIALDSANGCVLYEKNADAVIPPASMTKLAALYVALAEVAAGRVSLDDEVPLPPESWAENAPPGSSVMGLARGQRVTLRELLLGMAVPSGNDAAVAVAVHIAGSVEAFCARMNAEMRALGLTRTRFADASGYSELNETTPREFAAFARAYILRYPEALPLFHAQKTFAYPQAHNLPAGAKQTPPVEFRANPVFSAVAGCDGLKTGYIDESGYNLALTARRGGTRFIAVMMNGPGRGMAEGNRYRLKDAAAVSEWAFASFASYAPDAVPPLPLSVLGGTECAAYLVPAYGAQLTVPRPDSAGQAGLPVRTPEEAAAPVSVRLETPLRLARPVPAGTPVGKAVYSLGDAVLAEVPLVADRTIKRAGALKRAVDRLAAAILVP
jgi:D-alanyl-D-alanine carboxypeptidase (penicillin-binding protein 5/6)